MDIVSIDAIKYESGWEWNDLRKVGEIEKEVCGSDRKLLKWLRDERFLSEASKGRVVVQRDEDIVVVNRKSGQPLFAIMGGEYE